MKSPDSVPVELLARTRRAAVAWVDRRQANPGPLASGQLLLLAESVEPLVGWAVLRRDGDDVLLVAADTSPLVGGGDLAVRISDLGVATLRPAFWLRKSAPGLGSPVVLGTLSATDLARAETRWSALVEGRPVGLLGEQEMSESGEYRDWIEDTIRPARARLESLGAKAEVAPPLSFPPPTPRRPDTALWLRTAAAVALVGLLGLLVVVGRQVRRIEALESAVQAATAAHQKEVSALEEKRRGLEERHRAELAAAGEDRDRLLAAHRTELGALQERLTVLRRSTELRNPVFAHLDSEDVVRGSDEIELPPAASHVVLRIAVDEPAATTFRVELVTRRTGETVLSSDGLVPDAIGFLTLGVPAPLLPPGVYRVRMFVRDGKGWRALEDHQLVVREPRRPRRY